VQPVIEIQPKRTTLRLADQKRRYAQLAQERQEQAALIAAQLEIQRIQAQEDEQIALVLMQLMLAD
jgi:hypothetical protein